MEKKFEHIPVTERTFAIFRKYKQRFTGTIPQEKYTPIGTGDDKFIITLLKL